MHISLINKKQGLFSIFFTALISLWPGVGITEPSALDGWARTARIAGAAVWVGMTQDEITQLVAEMVAENVSVIEADSNLSNYLSDAEFEQELALMRDVVTVAHAKGLKVVWYYPALEVLTANGVNVAHTMYKDHPDWVQIGLNGSPNVFYGGDGRVFWVEPGMESAWMSPDSDYRIYYLNRVKKMAATGIDGLWVDVPVLNDIGVQWADINPSAVTKFTRETALSMPSAVNWNDPVWRRWISWRYRQIRDFLTAVRDAGNAIDPNFTLFVETNTMDYNAATSIALDGADIKDLAGATQVWEIDAVSDDTAMRQAREDDWISLIAMNKFARGASGDKPAWVFTYGKQSDDAELVMAEALAAGNNPYETKIPEMATTVGSAYRTSMFAWIKANEPYLYGTQSSARVAVLYSPASRDFVDKAQGTGLYATTDSSDPLWWSTDAIDSAYQRQYLAEHRGMVKLLVHHHIPFNVVVKPTDPADLASYDTVILPDIEAIADTEAELLRAYVNDGGHLIVTGPNPSGWDEYGSSRPEYALSDVLGLQKACPLPPSHRQTYGAGEARFFAGLLGKQYFTSSDTAAAQSLLTALRETSRTLVSMDADRRVHIELTETGNKLILHYVNFMGVTGTFSVVPTQALTTLSIPLGKEVETVEVTSPDNATPELAPLGFVKGEQTVSFAVPIKEYSLVVVSLK